MPISEASRRYMNSPKGRAAREKYMKSPKGIAARKRYMEKKRAEKEIKAKEKKIA